MQTKFQLIKESITSIPNYPHPPVIFRDITTLLENPVAFKTAIELILDHYKGEKFDKIVGTEARGFIFAAPLAVAMGVGLVPVRKPNKLPRPIYRESYQLEYGEDILEIHKDSIKPGEKVLIVDDLLATGGTLLATTKLIEKCGGIVKDAAFVIDLPELGGRKKLTDAGLKCFSLVDFEGK